MITESKKLPPSLSLIPPQLDLARHLVSAQIQTGARECSCVSESPFLNKNKPKLAAVCEKGVGGETTPFVISMSTKGSKIPWGSEGQGKLIGEPEKSHISW